MAFPIHTEIIAYHGWGFDASCWAGWRLKLGQQGYRLQLFDRGYFRQASQPTFKAANLTKILFTHSYGLHLCPKEQLQQADKLVIFGGFYNFHPEQISLRKRSQQMLQQMMQQFERHPELVLTNFQAKCYHPQPPALLPIAPKADSLRTDLLLTDLMDLDRATIDLALLQPLPQIVILHGSQDRIVSVSRGQALATHLSNSRYFEIASAGHALPFTHLEACWSILQPMLEL